MNNATRRNCPGCSSAKAKLLGEKNGYEIFVCTDCDSLFTSRLPLPAETEDYDSYYTEANLHVPDVIIGRVETIVSSFDRYRCTGQLLDIGFGAGTILDVASRAGWNVRGQEVSATAVNRAKEKGHDVFLGDLWDANYLDDNFDIVTCSEILEHLFEPQRLLNEIARILRPGGLFWATTPSAQGASFRLMGTAWSVLSPPEHTQLYSKKGLKGMLSSANFTNVKIKTHGINPRELKHFYCSRKDDRSSDVGFNRVQAAYELNEKLSSSQTGLLVKGFLNAVLDLFNIGDSLKVFAEK